MRITAEAKTETRKRIMEAATSLFKSQGWHQATTRGIAVAAGIATGTLFNYFPTKEAIAAELIGGGLRRARQFIFDRRRSERGTRSRPLFAHLVRLPESSGVSQFSPPAAETIFSPLARSSPQSAGRFDPCRSSGARGGDCSPARLHRSEVGGYNAALLDALSGGVRILGGETNLRDRRYARAAGSVTQTVCHVAEHASISAGKGRKSHERD